MTNSRDKGARGEREFASYLRAHGYEARRGVQYQGGPDSEDVTHNIPGVHLEVKRVERLELHRAYKQACDDAAAADTVPVVAYRSSRKPWMAILSFDDLIKLLKEAAHDVQEDWPNE